MNLISEKQLEKFNTIEYQYPHNIDYSDYLSMQEFSHDRSIVTCGWMCPHEDQPMGDEDVWNSQVLHIDKKLTPVFTFADNSGKINGIILETVMIVPFNFKNTHALLPIKIAHACVKSQSFECKEIMTWMDKREKKGYKEKAKMVYKFLDLPKLITISDFN